MSQKVRLDWLVSRLELGITTVLAILELVLERISNYKQDKVVKGRMATDRSCFDIQLTTDSDSDYGLIGLKFPPGNSVPV